MVTFMSLIRFSFFFFLSKEERKFLTSAGKRLQNDNNLIFSPRHQNLALFYV